METTRTLHFDSNCLALCTASGTSCQCKATFQYDEVGILLLDKIGEDCIMWGNDFPHPDGVCPDSMDYIDKQFGHLPTATKHKIVCENAARFYGLVPD